MPLSLKPKIALCALALTTTLAAQKPAATPRPHPFARQKELIFAEEVPLIGLPPGTIPSRLHCTEDGAAFFDSSAESASQTDLASLYRIAPSGQVKGLRRTLPISVDGPLSVQGFTAGAHTLATLLKIDHPDDAPRAEPHYLLSVSDHEGDFAKLVTLDLRFTPIRLSIFGTGEFLVLGWDEVNRLPLLTTLKEDGSILRFLTVGSKEQAELQKAEFVPWGNDLLLTYPGTTNSIRVLRTSGEDRLIPWFIPAGYVLHDLLVTGTTYSLLLRVQEPAHPKEQRLFEVSSSNGSLIRELTADPERIAAITCAHGSRITAIFKDTIAAKGEKSTPEDVKQWVLGTATR